MALTKTITLDSGLTVSDVYVRIDNQAGRDSVRLTVNYYVSRTQFYAGSSALAPSKNYTFTPDITSTGANFIKQGYVYLKTTDDFSDATDVLES